MRVNESLETPETIDVIDEGDVGDWFGAGATGAGLAAAIEGFAPHERHGTAPGATPVEIPATR